MQFWKAFALSVLTSSSCWWNVAYCANSASGNQQSDEPGQQNKNHANTQSESKSRLKAKDRRVLAEKGAAEEQSKKGKSEQESKNKAKSDSNSSNKDKDKDEKSEKDEKNEKNEKNEPKLSVTEHTVMINGKSVRYKATAGYMLMKDFSEKKKSSETEKDKDKDKDKDKKAEHKTLAKVFYIAYTRQDDENASKRPVAFTFNGGPGSASIWLHMGGLGPRRAVLSDRGEALPPPYKLEDNNESWLDKTDLVFIDPVSTGFSRTEPDEDPKKFHGFSEDIESVSEFIRLYLTKNQRWSSPKFIIGESYGTTRAAGLSDFMQRRYGIYFNGIVLVSTVLNFSTIDFNPGNEMPFVMFLPSYAATAWYHKMLSPDMQAKPLSQVLRESEEFASHEYRDALFEGDRLSDARAEEISQKMSRFTGLPAAFLKRANNRIEDSLFFTKLLYERNRQLGRFDSRFTGVRYNPGTEQSEFDPSSEAVLGTYTAAFNEYVRKELKYESELPYESFANVWPWSWRNAQNKYLDVSDDLRKAMSRNPYLKVWLCCGYYDLATPYFASKYTADQLLLDPTIRGNVRLTYYPAGHMMYILKAAREQLKDDFNSFLSGSILPASAVVPTAEP